MLSTAPSFNPTLSEVGDVSPTRSGQMKRLSNQPDVTHLTGSEISLHPGNRVPELCSLVSHRLSDGAKALLTLRSPSPSPLENIQIYPQFQSCVLGRRDEPTSLPQALLPRSRLHRAKAQRTASSLNHCCSHPMNRVPLNRPCAFRHVHAHRLRDENSSFHFTDKASGGWEDQGLL